MDIDKAIAKLSKFLEIYYEFPLFGLGDDNIEAIETLVEYVKNNLKQ